MSSSQDLFKKMNEDYESLAKQLQPTSNTQQAQNSNSQAQTAPAQEYSNQYQQQDNYDPYEYSAGYNYYGMEQQSQQQQQFSAQEPRGYDHGGQSEGYYQNKGSNDQERTGYQGRKPYSSNYNGKRFDERERKPFNQFGESRYSGQGGHSGGSQGGFHITGTKVFVNNIEEHVTEADITQMFGTYGKINDMKVFHRPDQNYAYIIYERYEDAYSAANSPSPNLSWSISLAKSKNTVMQYQQSSMYAQTPGGALPPLPYKNSSKYYPGGGTVEQYKRPFNKFGSEINNNGRGGNFKPKSMGDPSQQQGKLPVESHLSAILNNCKDPNELMDLMLLPPDRVESLATNKTQINQTILVREIWICSISAKCQGSIHGSMEENFGPVEEIEFFPRGDQSFAFVRFFMVQTAYFAFSNKEKVAELLGTNSLKLTYSDPSRRRNIIGDHKDYMKDENLSPVLYVSFPYGFKISKHVIMKIASDYGTVLNVTVKRSEDQKQTSSVLIEFQDLAQTKFAYSHLREDHERMNPKCEFAILLNSEKFIKENNVRLKEKAKEYPITPRFPGKPTYGGAKHYSDNGGQPINRGERGNRGYSDHYEHENGLQNNKEQQGLDVAGGFDSAEEYFNEEDDEEYVWSGFISLKSKGRCGMDAKVLSGPSVLDFENHNLIMNIKCPIDEALRTTPYAVVLFKPSNQTQAKPFMEIKQHIDSTPNQAGVVVAKNFTIYLIPSGEEATRLHSDIKEFNIVAICLTPESIRGSKTKKDYKIQEKSTFKENNTSSYAHSSAFNPEDTQEEQDDDLYDPSQISNTNKNQNETTNLSELIDNPNLVETMMKNAP